MSIKIHAVTSVSRSDLAGTHLGYNISHRRIIFIWTLIGGVIELIIDVNMYKGLNCLLHPAYFAR